MPALHRNFSGRHAEKVIAMSSKNDELRSDFRKRYWNCVIGNAKQFDSRRCCMTSPGATKFLLPEGTTLVTMHLILGSLLWLLSL
jgi:hypothetical protein